MAATLQHAIFPASWLTGQEPNSEGKKLSRKLSRKLSQKLSRKLSRKLSWDVLSILWKVKIFSTEIPLSILKTQKIVLKKEKLEVGTYLEIKIAFRDNFSWQFSWQFFSFGIELLIELSVPNWIIFPSRETQNLSICSETLEERVANQNHACLPPAAAVAAVANAL